MKESEYIFLKNRDNTKTCCMFKSLIKGLKKIEYYEPI